jgi:hypothetical protein
LLLSAGLESKGANIERGFESGRTSCRRWRVSDWVGTIFQIWQAKKKTIWNLLTRQRRHNLNFTFLFLFDFSLSYKVPPTKDPDFRCTWIYIKYLLYFSMK